MAEPKTRKTDASVEAFLGRVDPARRADCARLVAMMKQATGAAPAMWGPAIVGFGTTHLRYASGRELDWPVMGFSPRKGDLSIYLSCDIEGEFGAELAKLGRHRHGKGCLWVKRLADVDLEVLERMIARAAKAVPPAERRAAEATSSSKPKPSAKPKSKSTGKAKVRPASKSKAASKPKLSKNR